MSLLTSQELRELTFRAASLVERRALLPAASAVTADDQRLAALLRTWAQAYAPGRVDAFERRLAWDDFSLDMLRAVVADAADAAAVVEPAPWTAWLSSVLDGLPALAREVLADSIALPERQLFATATAEEPPFIEVLAAWSRVAVARLVHDTPTWSDAAPAVRAALERQLLRELSGVSELALHARFQTWRAAARPTRGPDDAYADFVRALLRGGLVDFWVTSPVTARHLAIVAGTWTRATHEFLTRTAHDRDVLEPVFGALGPLTDVRPALSDPHDGRRRVAIATFASGTSLVYKPRDVRLELAWQTFVGWARGAGLTLAPPGLRVVDCQSHGWCECARRAEFGDAGAVSQYYRVAGSLLALTYALRARDLQMENVIATADGPAVIDAEMFCQPTRRVELDDQGRPRPESCLSSGLLTMAHVGPADAIFDIGGLRGDGVTPTSLGRRMWHGQGTAAVGFSEARVVTAPSDNRVLLDGALQDPASYRGALLEGFRDTYRFLMAHRDAILAADGPLASFAAGATRVLFRPSQHYGSVQYALAAPSYQTSGALRSCGLDTLNRVFNIDETRPTLWPVVDAERRALDALDLPRFVIGVDGTTVRGDSGDLDVPFFATTGLAGVRALVASLSDEDLARQLALLDMALANGVGTRLETPLSGAPDDAAQLTTWLTGEAFALGREIVNRGARDGEALRWPLLAAMPGRWARHVLYDGSLGAALFLASLGRVSGETAWHTAARAATDDLLCLIDIDPTSATAEIGVGGCSGTGSMLYGLAALHVFSGDARYREAAVALTAAHTDADVAGAGCDVTSGAAGMVLALMALDAVVPESGARALAVRFGDRLLASELPAADGGGWPARNGSPIAGFAHGSAGVALALARLADASGEARFRDAARRGLAHERTCFVAALGNWPVLGALDPVTGSGHSVMTAWCHGAAGIALSRACLPEADRDDAVDAELAAALNALATTPLTALDQICCGNLGRADILHSLAARLGRPELAAEAQALAVRVADRASRRQVYGLRGSGVDYRVFDPGLFRGLGGVGYALLRAAHPGVLPSVLAFEVSASVGPAPSSRRSPS